MFYTMYKDTAGYWRWRYTASNGRIIAVSSESYHNKSDCLSAINIMKASKDSPVYEE